MRRWSVAHAPSSTDTCGCVHSQALLDAIVAEPEAPVGQLSIIGPEEHSRLLVDFNSSVLAPTELFHEQQTLHGLLEHWSAAAPDAPAAIFEVPAVLFCV